MDILPNPDVDLTTLAMVKAWLGITNTTQDDLLQMLITAESQYISSWCTRDFILHDHVEQRDGLGGPVMLFGEYPVSAVQSIKINGQVQPPAVLGQNVGYLWTRYQVQMQYTVFTAGIMNVELAYTAGYAPGAIPADLAQAATELTAFRYKQKDRIGVSGSQSIDGQSVSFGGGGPDGNSGAGGADMPQAVRTILQQYKKVIQIMPS